MRNDDVVVVESSVWIDYLHGSENAETLWLEKHLIGRRISLLDLTLCEVLQGMRSDKAFAQAVDDLSEFQVFSTGGASLALVAARNYRSLRRRGITIRQIIDCLIATYCIQNGFFLLHRDRDFDPFEKYLGLRVVHPAIPRVQ